ncbi:hypothetical protein [Streptomyces sp. NPDC000880]
MRAAGVFTALERGGLAGDSDVAALPGVVGLRLRIAAGETASRCCGSASMALVAAAPTDPSLPEAVAAALDGLAAGSAVAATALDELVGGWIAMPGRDVEVAASADLGHDAVVAVAFDDAVAFLLADHDDRLVVHTTAVLAGSPDAAGESAGPPAGWQVVAHQVPSVPLLIAAPHADDGSCAA